MQLYADEDFFFPVVEHLRRLGHDVVTAQEARRIRITPLSPCESTQHCKESWRAVGISASIGHLDMMGCRPLTARSPVERSPHIESSAVARSAIISTYIQLEAMRLVKAARRSHSPDGKLSPCAPCHS